ALGGADAGNYTLAANTASATADITKATINAVTGITAGNRVYDGTTGASLNLAGATFAGRLAGDTLILGAPVTGAFSDKNVANGKTVAIGGLALGGADAGNYTLASNVARTIANITPASLVVTATGANRVYDTTTNASVALSDNRIAGDVLSISNTGASFANKNAGVNKTVTVGGIAIGGADAGNYVVNTSATTTATMTQATLAVRVNNAEKDQGRTNPDFTASYTGLLGGDTVASEVADNLVFTTDATTGSAAGDYLVSAGGQTAVNYTLAYTPGVLTVKPTEALQSALSNVLGTVTVAPSQGNMVQANMVVTKLTTTVETATVKGDAAVATTQPAAAPTTSTAPVVQIGPTINTNVLPGLRLSVIDTGLRLTVSSGDGTSVESR
uniref:YDG domain-containing protein n=1 Tax=Massilia sp. S19_KUP03_FR1 TaxID=3025503 RepID=UPI002FCDCF8B